MFDQARDAMKKGDYARACPKVAESHRVDPQPGTLANLAVCEDKQGAVASAWTHAREALEQLPATDDRVPVLKAIAARAEKRLPKLVIRLAAGAPKGARVRRDAVELGDASLGEPLPVDPGEHTITVTAAGRKDAVQKVTVGEGKTVQLEVAAGDVEESAPPRATSDAPPVSKGDAVAPTSPSSGSGNATLGYVLGGVGIVGIGVGVVTGVILSGKKSTVNDPKDGCDQSARTCNSGASLDAAHSGAGLLPLYYGGLAVGVLGLAAGAYFILTSGPDKPATSLSVGPTGASLSGRF
jgi:hypothetical protein